MFRHQLPAYSPLTMGGVLRALGRAGRGPVDELRHRLCERYAAGRAVLCGSGTEALTLALRSSARPGNPPLVALPAYACYDLVSAAVGADARIVFYDVDPDTLSPDVASLEEACARGPDAVVVAHLYGLPVQWNAVEGVVRASGALLVEDAAQGVGGTWQGRPLGSLGDVSVLSFGRGKGWSGGEGGALLERDPRSEAPQPDSTHGSGTRLAAKVAAQWVLGRPGVYWMPTKVPGLGLGETHYHPPRDPSDILPLAAALVLENDEPAIREAEARRENAGALVARLEARGCAGSLLHTPLPVRDAGGGFLRLPLLTARGMAGFASPPRARALGIMPGYPMALPRLAEAAARLEGPAELPGGLRLAQGLITLPTHTLLTGPDLDLIADMIATLTTERSGRP